ncbi:MAG TPA: DegT/DnrJ/EryC1/StrS family aminotransferase [Bryobacteraceae bacterium]|nr:DegT/DnrJ/EryC1/StrS family aminotransferase [Bryobacteraceae bacterium]
MHIPSWPQAGEREAELLCQVLASPQWGGFHPFVAEFEEKFARFQHSSFGVSTFNGTVSLELALTVLDIGPGDEVIVPAISFITTATAVSRVGAVPVFVDIDPLSFNIDPAQVRNAISNRTKAIMAVHFGGVLCDMAALSTICQEHHLTLLEDAAHAQGAEWCGQRAGSFGLVGSFSFQNGKVLSAGEGGMLVTSDPEFAARARSIANCGRLPGRPFYEHYNLGTNFRLTAFQAAVLLAQLERLPGQILTRSQNAARLKAFPSDIAWQKEPTGATANSFYLLAGRARNEETRDRICQSLRAAAVPCTPFYPHTLYQNELYRRASCRVLSCPVAEQCLKDAFWLPHRVLLADPASIDQIATLIRACLRPETGAQL